MDFKLWRKFPVKNCAVISLSPGYEGKFRLAAVTQEKYDFHGKCIQKGRIKIFSTHANKFEQPIVSKEITKCVEVEI